MKPRIRYCRTPAGRVAYATSGTGPPLLCDSGWITDLHGQLELFAFGAFIERLAGRFTVIRFDKPGCGLSDRDGTDLTFDGQVAAALAVADAVGADRFRLSGELAALTRFQQTCASPAAAARLLEVYYDTDIRALLPTVTAPVQPGLRHRGQGDHRREPAAQPAARDHPRRCPGRPRPGRRLRNPRPGPGATRALG